VAHLFDGVRFPAVLVGALQRTGFERVLGTPLEALGLGVGYGALLWLVGAGLVTSRFRRCFRVRVSLTHARSSYL
jgi:hypothetical protein